ncbi:MAG: L,D-transpeptidase family protein [Sphingomonas sp.]|uniref:L,D-transpeptidase family protein n=1 Tax=Sphingomonas sp. TaxID=28214 RepID=UPI001B133DD4|nr:L,D-transpeptidase family protein [Sphingomonas sp.]MBO9622305.1 L,D-transpeptidase family protein [Sphingomonas sp.]
MQSSHSSSGFVSEISRRLSKGISTASLALLLGTALPTVAAAQGPVQVSAEEISAELGDGAGLDKKLKPFYAARNYRPIWVTAAGPRPEAQKLLAILESAELDGLDPDKFRVGAIRDALDDAQEKPNPERLARVEAVLSNGFVNYVRALRRVKNPSIEFTDPELRITVPEKEDVLAAAASAPSLSKYVAEQGWMHPFYGQLRNALLLEGPQSPRAEVMRVNLQRLRVLPADDEGRHVVVDTAGTRLFMFEGRRLVGSMKVITGKPSTPTPMMASVIRYATLNPYWNVPTDLAREKIAPEVVGTGPAYLRQHGYQLLSDWSADATVADPSLVDWQSVLTGQRVVRVRQLPGVTNGMGKVKFMFPNGHDIYLHDTPDKGLFRNGVRHFSAGCIRLEDAPRLGRWLFGKPLRATSKEPELRVDLPDPVPIYVTYLTAFPEANSVAIREDSYGRDGLASGGTQQAALSGG